MATFFDLPEVAREKIFRSLDLLSQQDFFEAFNETNYDHVLDRIKVHREEVSCWLCMSEKFLTDFWPVSQPYGETRGGTHGPMQHEPKHKTKGFEFVYKLSEEEHGRQLFIPRDRKNPEDAREMDKVFDEFVKDISSVFKAKSSDEMRTHFELEHGTLANFSPRFFENYTQMKGNIILNPIFTYYLFYVIYLDIY